MSSILRLATKGQRPAHARVPPARSASTLSGWRAHILAAAQSIQPSGVPRLIQTSSRRASWDNDQTVKQLEADGRNHEQTDGGDLWRVVPQERPQLRPDGPSLHLATVA